MSLNPLNEAELEIIYADNGRGIPVALHERVFEPFFTSRREAGNTGLGLHIVHNLITGKLRGRIDMEHPHAGGVQFRILSTARRRGNFEHGLVVCPRSVGNVRDEAECKGPQRDVELEEPTTVMAWLSRFASFSDSCIRVYRWHGIAQGRCCHQ